MHKFNGDVACITFQKMMARPELSPTKARDEKEEEHLCGYNQRDALKPGLDIQLAFKEQALQSLRICQAPLARMKNNNEADTI